MRGVAEVLAADLSEARKQWMANRSDMSYETLAAEFQARAAAVMRQLVPSCGRVSSFVYRKGLPPLPARPTQEGLSYPLLVDPRCRFSDLHAWSGAIGDKHLWDSSGELGDKPYWVFCALPQMMNTNLLQFSRNVCAPVRLALGWEGIFFLKSYRQTLPDGQTLLLATENPGAAIKMERRGDKIEYRLVNASDTFDQVSFLTCARG